MLALSIGTTCGSSLHGLERIILLDYCVMNAWEFYECVIDLMVLLCHRAPSAALYVFSCDISDLDYQSHVLSFIPSRI